MATTASLADASSDQVRPEEEVFGLVLAWSAEEPARAGEIALVDKPCFLGRSDEDGSAARVRFIRQRPGGAVGRGTSVEGRAISRRQIEIEPTEGGLRVRRVGRCPMAINGEPSDGAVLVPGDTVLLERQLLLFCVRRPKVVPPLRYFPEDNLGAFGAPDKLGVLGEALATWRLRERIAFAAKADTHVLLVGPSGTGKELAARAIHALSRRGRRPIVARNAATLPAGLIDAELFGNVKNYPNPGMPERPGLIGQAHGGILFLDEIGELPAEMQAHLLRVLDAHGEYQRLGEATARSSDLLLIGATNRSPREMKHDLLARMTVRVELPSLADRMEDIPLLFRHLLIAAAARVPDLAERFVASSGAEKTARVDGRLVDHLLRRRFPLNVRELDAVLWRAMESSPSRDVLTLTDEVLEAEAEARGDAGVPEPSGPLPSAAEPRAEPSGDEVRACLAAQQGSITKTAKALGLPSRYALYRILKKHGIPIPSR